MRPVGTLIALILSALGIALGPMVSPAVAANSVWHQSVQRASAEAPCPEPTFGSPWQSTWNPDERPWRPSWAWWPNGGTGGFTCDRMITWARAVYPSTGCQLYPDGSLNTYYVNFAGGWSIGSGQRYTDTGCTILYNAGGSTGTNPIDLSVVYAPPGWNPMELCLEAFGSAANMRRAGSTDVWSCSAAVG